jgi:hypothetical protein
LTANIFGNRGGTVEGEEDGSFKLSFGALNFGLVDAL